MQIVTNHNIIGFAENVKIIKNALREKYTWEVEDEVVEIVAGFIWCQLSVKLSDTNLLTWDEILIENALDSIQRRINKMREVIKRKKEM